MDSNEKLKKYPMSFHENGDNIDEGNWELSILDLVPKG